MVQARLVDNLYCKKPEKDDDGPTAGSTKSMFEQVAEILEGEGWKVSSNALNYNPPHIDKFKDLSNVFAERMVELIRVRIDGVRCKHTVISMDNSPLNTDYTKSKKSEGKSSLDQELATHLSDTVDYYILWKLKGGRGYAGGGGDFDLDYFQPSDRAGPDAVSYIRKSENFQNAKGRGQCTKTSFKTGGGIKLLIVSVLYLE